MLDFAKMLDATEAKLGRPPRKRGLFQPDWRMWPPDWLTRDDEIIEIFDAESQVLKRGRVVWGVLMQANKMLFSNTGSHAKFGAPAAVLFSEDERARHDPLAIGSWTTRIFAFKEQVEAGHPPEDPDERMLGETLARELDRPSRLRVPDQFTPGCEVFMTTIYVDRRHLPNRRLEAGLFPILILPELTGMALVVPHWFWPREFTRTVWC